MEQGHNQNNIGTNNNIVVESLTTYRSELRYIGIIYK